MCKPAYHSVPDGVRPGSAALTLVRDHAPEDLRPHGMEVELETGRDAEVAAAPTQGPEEIGRLLGGGAHDLARRGDELDAAQVVHG